MKIIDKIDSYINEMFGKKPDKEDQVLLYKLREAHGVSGEFLKFIDSQVIEGGNRSWWVILAYHTEIKKYFGLTIDGELFDDKSKSKALKWIKDQKFMDNMS